MEHSNLFKLKGPAGQEKRRDEFLRRQESRREELLLEHRQLLERTKQPKSHRDKKCHYLPVSEMLMLSEWLNHPPEDFETNWLFKVCPQGRRCLVYAENGKTRAVTKKGKLLGTWQTKLPGDVCSGKSQTTTILDCIYSNEAKTYYVIDVLHWGDHALVGTEMTFRQFWIDSRFSEDFPDISIKSSTNPHPIVPLTAHVCSAAEMDAELSRFPYFPVNCPKVDGILFFHKNAYYTQGETPLVTWLKPFMVSEIFGGFSVSPEYFADRPENYENYLKFMEEFDENKLKKGRRKKDRQNVEMSEVGEVSDDSSHLVDVELEG